MSENAALFWSAQHAIEAGNTEGARAILKVLAACDYGPALYVLAEASDDPEAGAELTRRAAEGGDIEAQAMLGYRYFMGNGVESDYARARQWYGLAAEHGEPFSQKAMGHMWENGQGGHQNFEEAAHWYARAAEQGHEPAMYHLGLLYTMGRGVPLCPPMAYFWLALAAAGEHPDAAIKRDVVLAFLTPEQTKKAQHLAMAWRPLRH